MKLNIVSIVALFVMSILLAGCLPQLGVGLSPELQANIDRLFQGKFENVQEVKMTPARAWAAISDVATWPQWTGWVKSAQPLAVGSTGDWIHDIQGVQLTGKYRITQLSPEKMSYTLEKEILLSKLIVAYEVQPGADANTAKVYQRLHFTGIAAPIYAMLVGTPLQEEGQAALQSLSTL